MRRALFTRPTWTTQPAVRPSSHHAGIVASFHAVEPPTNIPTRRPSQGATSVADIPSCTANTRPARRRGPATDAPMTTRATPTRQRQYQAPPPNPNRLPWPSAHAQTPACRTGDRFGTQTKRRCRVRREILRAADSRPQRRAVANQLRAARLGFASYLCATHRRSFTSGLPQRRVRVVGDDHGHARHVRDEPRRGRRRRGGPSRGTSQNRTHHRCGEEDRPLALALGQRARRVEATELDDPHPRVGVPRAGAVDGLPE